MNTKILVVASIFLASGCATEKGNVRHAQHASDQVRIVAVQREAMVQEAKAEASTQLALMEALARVAEANPQEASSVAVALAVIGTRASQQDKSNTPVIGLQRQSNEALEWTKALAPTVGGLITGVGIAAINAETQRNASDNNRDILLGDQVADRGIVEAVAGLGSVAAAQTGIEVSGDYYDLEDSASVDNSIVTTTSEDTTTTTETTTTTSYSMDTTIDYQGTNMTLSELVTTLKSAGATYSIDLNNDGVADVSGGDGTTSITKIECQVTFGPTPPQCQ
jgi:hypothetical protein